MNHIPPEILTHIFAGNPILASHVCHRWRAISIGDPRLWDSPVFVVNPITSRARLSLLALWLSRSANQPLHVTLKMDPFAQLPQEACKIALLAFKTLAAHTSRWETLTLTLPAAYDIFSAFCLALTVAPPLECLRTAHVSLGNWADDDGDKGAFALLSRSPVLRELSWSNRRAWGMWDAPLARGVPDLSTTRGLVRLTLDTFVTSLYALSLLSHAPTLTFLELTHLGSPLVDEPTYGAEAQFTPDAPLCAPALRMLTVYQHTLDDALPTLLARLRCPTLSHLSITCGFLPPDCGPASAALSAFLAYSGANLQELALDGSGIGPAHLAVTLIRTPKLEKLAVHAVRGGPAVDDALLAALTVPIGPPIERDGGVLCPRLHGLVLHRTVACSDGALAAMLRSRRANDETGGVADRHGTDVDGTSVVVRLASVNIDLSPCFCATNARDAAYLSLCDSRCGD